MPPERIDSLDADSLKGLALSLMARIDELAGQNDSLQSRIDELLKQISTLLARIGSSNHERPRKEWIEIPVSAIVSEEAFALV
jgi:hypothetical protein